MKKFYTSVAAAAALVMGFGTVFAAGNMSLTAKTDTASVSYTYNLGLGQTVEYAADRLFTQPGKERSVNKTLTVTSTNRSGRPLEVLLRFEIEKAPEDTEYSPLDYYSFEITEKNAKNGIVYSSADAGKTAPDALVKDISLGEFNDKFTKDTKTYTLEYAVNSEVAKEIKSAEASKIKVKLVSREYDASIPRATFIPKASAIPTESAEPSRTAEPNITETAEPTTEPTESAEAVHPTLKPQFEPGPTVETHEAAPTPKPSEPNIAPAATQAPTPTPEATAAPKEKKIICGTDIKPGRYVVSGNAIVRVTDANGNFKSETSVTDGTYSGINGVKDFVVTLSKGDVVTILPLADDIKAAVDFTDSNQATPKPTASVRTVAAAARATASPKPTAAVKRNPSTGDSRPAVMVVSSLMALSAIFMAALEILKRKKYNK